MQRVGCITQVHKPRGLFFQDLNDSCHACSVRWERLRRLWVWQPAAFVQHSQARWDQQQSWHQRVCVIWVIDWDLEIHVCSATSTRVNTPADPVGCNNANSVHRQRFTPNYSGVANYRGVATMRVGALLASLQEHVRGIALCNRQTTTDMAVFAMAVKVSWQTTTASVITGTGHKQRLCDILLTHIHRWSQGNLDGQCCVRYCCKHFGLTQMMTLMHIKTVVHECQRMEMDEWPIGHIGHRPDTCHMKKVLHKCQRMEMDESPIGHVSDTTCLLGWITMRFIY